MHWNHDRGLAAIGVYNPNPEKNSYLQNPHQEGQTPTGDYKREVESFVATICQLGGTLELGSTLMVDILATPLPGPITSQAYERLDAAAWRPYDILYMDLIVTIIMTKNCGYGSLRKWLAQNQMSPGAQAYPTKSNDLVEMMNSKTFEPNPVKPKNEKKRNCGQK